MKNEEGYYYFIKKEEYFEEGTTSFFSDWFYPVKNFDEVFNEIDSVYLHIPEDEEIEDSQYCKEGEEYQYQIYRIFKNDKGMVKLFARYLYLIPKFASPDKFVHDEYESEKFKNVQKVIEKCYKSKELFMDFSISDFMPLLVDKTKDQKFDCYAISKFAVTIHRTITVADNKIEMEMVE